MSVEPGFRIKVRNDNKKMFAHFLFLVKIEGESCWPELVSGRRYFATPLLRPKADRFVIFKNPGNSDQILVKKVLGVIDSGILELGGTVSWSSRFKVPASSVLGTLIHH